MLLLPKPNMDAIKAIFSFFKWFTELGYFDSEQSRFYNLNELGTIFGTYFLVNLTKRLPVGMATIAEMLVLLLENQDEFFCVPTEFVCLLADLILFTQDGNSLLISSKDLIL